MKNIPLIVTGMFLLIGCFFVTKSVIYFIQSFLKKDTEDNNIEIEDVSDEIIEGITNLESFKKTSSLIRKKY